MGKLTDRIAALESSRPSHDDSIAKDFAHRVGYEGFKDFFIDGLRGAERSDDQAAIDMLRPTIRWLETLGSEENPQWQAWLNA